jgi:site-specific DNA-methyltransferase (adenine-specific)
MSEKRTFGSLELNHIYQMDCIEGMRLLPDESVDMVITDPPYNIGYIPQRKLKSEGGYARNGIANDNLSETEFMSWLDNVCFEIDRVLKDDSYVFMFCGWSTIYQFQPILQKYWTVKALHIWKKNVFGIGYYSRPQYEPFFMCMKGKPEKPKKAPSDVWEYKKVYKSKKTPHVHSCQKPVDLLEDIIKIYGNGTNIILEPFAGSGSTCVAALRTGRHFIGFEIEPEYVRIANQRIENVRDDLVERKLNERTDTE